MAELFIRTRGHGATHLVLLHGWAMAGSAFEPLAERLEDRCTLHIVDLPGHGRSRESDVSLRPAECARAIAKAVPAAVWLGWSLGGVIALQAALDLPEQVRALAMLCASPCFVRNDQWQHAISPEILQQFADKRARHDDPFVDLPAADLGLRHALEALGSDSAQEDLRQLRRDTFAEQPPSAHALCEGLEVLEHTDLRARVHELARPSAWIAGRRDRLVPWQAMQWSANACGGAFTCIRGGGHAPFIGHADEMVAALEPLLPNRNADAVASVRQ